MTNKSFVMKRNYWIGGIFIVLILFNDLAAGKKDENLFLIHIGGYDDTKFGFIDETGQVVIAPQFEWARDFSEGLAAVRKNGNKWGFIDKTGKMVINNQFSAAGDFSEGLAVVVVNGKMGYIDKNGNSVVEPEFVAAGEFSEGMAHVGERKGRNLIFGYIDKKGQMVITLPPGISGRKFFNGMAAISCHIEINKKEKNNKDEQPEAKSMPWKLESGTFPSEKSKTVEKYGYINKAGEIIIPPQFKYVGDFSEGLAQVRIDKKFGYIDKTGKKIISPQFDEAGMFSEGLARITIQDKIGYIDKTGTIKIAPQFALAGDFSEGLARVAVLQKRWFRHSVIKWGYIDKTGKMVIKPHYDSANDFSGGLAEVKVDGASCYIDKTNKIVWKSAN